MLAGAGSGKTRVIVEKIAHLIGCGRYPARRIAAITFTNKSARNARARGRLREQDADEVTICTFHALGLKFLQIEHAAVGLKRGFSIFDADDAAAQIKDLMYGAKPDDIEDMKNLVSRAKNAGLSPEQAMAAARSNREKEAASVYERYQLTRSMRLRRPDPPAGADPGREPGDRAGLARAHRLPAGGRMPGHQRRAVPPAQAAGRREGQLHLRRRR